VEPVLESVPPMPDQIAIKERIRDGVMSFQELWLAVRRRPAGLELSPRILADIDRQSPAILYRWMDFPTKPEADRLGALYHDENYFGQTKSATLCNEDLRARFRRDGARALFDDPHCYWPQGVMAQVHPRVVSIVRNGWGHASETGRLGALAAPGAEPSGLTDSELATLDHWIGKFSPRQVIFCGPASPEVAARLNGDGAGGFGGEPRLIIARGCPLCQKGGAVCGSVANEPEDSYACVRGHYADPRTLAAIRELIGRERDVAVVLSGELEDAEVEALLAGLAPFIGAKGFVMFPLGRYEQHEIEAATGIGRPLHAWVTSGAINLGFGFYQPTQKDKAAARDWVVLWHSPDAMDWSRQWMPIVADLSLDADPLASAGNVEPAESKGDAALGAGGATSEGKAAGGATDLASRGPLTSELR
jgi:hypothetical protein